MPRFVLDRLERAASSETLRVRVERGAFGFRHGLRLQGLRAYDLTRAAGPQDPIARAQSVTVDFWRDRMEVVEAWYPRLPDAYYGIKPAVERPEGPKGRIELPDLPPYRVVLERPHILGLQPARVRARLDVDPRRISVSDMHVVMPDRDRRLVLDAELTVDFDASTVSGRADGSVGHAQISPVIEVLAVDVAIAYVEAFTELTEPFPTTATGDANWDKGSLRLAFLLDVPRCRYQGVAMEKTKGAVRVASDKAAEGKDGWDFRVDIEVDDAVDPQGRHLAGKLAISDCEGPTRLYYGAASTLPFPDVMSVIDVFTEVTNNTVIVLDTPPEVSVAGTNAIDVADLRANNIAGRVRFGHGAVMGLRVNDVAGDVTLKGDQLAVKGVATGKTGGAIDFRHTIDLAGYEPEGMRYTLDVDYKGGSVEELADLLKFDLGERRGTVDAKVYLEGNIATNQLETLCGRGTVRVTDGKLAQMKLFAGLTAILADSVPGVSYLVNQSSGSGDFVIENGVYKIDNLLIEGGLVSLSAKGAYDMVNDALDFTVRVKLFKKDSLVGKIIQPLTSPITWGFMEFKLTGPIDNPTWRRVTMTERLF